MANLKKKPDEKMVNRTICISNKQEKFLLKMTNEKTLTLTVRKMVKYLIENKVKLK